MDFFLIIICQEDFSVRSAVFDFCQKEEDPSCIDQAEPEIANKIRIQDEAGSERSIKDRVQIPGCSNRPAGGEVALDDSFDRYVLTLYYLSFICYIRSSSSDKNYRIFLEFS